MHIVESFLPVFPGFYGTLFSRDDGEIETQVVKDELENKGYPDAVYECETLVVLIGNRSQLVRFDYGIWHVEWAIRITRAVEAFLKEHVGPLVRVEMQSLYSPREYNFTNDSINVAYHVTSLEDLRAWWKSFLADEQNASGWEQLLRAKFTSRDGFISFYSNTPEGWIEETDDYTKLDGVFLGIMFEAVAIAKEYDTFTLFNAVEEPDLHEFLEEGGIPEYDLLPAAVQDALLHYSNLESNAPGQLREYARLKPEFIGKAEEGQREKLHEEARHAVSCLEEHAVPRKGKSHGEK